MIKRSPSLTEQAKSTIKKRIINNEFAEGRIPSEASLANELGVSRTTIRDALSRLEIEGVIYRRQGAGTFVNEAGLQIHIRLEEIWTYEVMLEAHGYTPSNQIISVTEQPAEPHVVSDLSLSAADTTLTVKKLFLADEEPVIFTINHIPTHLIERSYTDTDFHRPIYQFLSNACRQELAYYVSEIVPLVAPDWLTVMLNLTPQHPPLISFDEIGYNLDNIPILKAQSYFRDDLLRLRLIRREAQ